MPGTCSEGWLSRDGSQGEQNSFDFVFTTFDEADENTAALLAIATAPPSYNGMPLKTVKRQQINDTTFTFILTYRVDEKQTAVSDPAMSSFNTTLSFNVVGGTEHVKNSETYTTYTKPGNTAIDFKGAIGVEVQGDRARVNGVDRFAPVLDYSYSTQFANSVVTNDYIDDLVNLTGKKNNAVFYGRPAGSVLFKGARGSKKGQDRWEIGFEFSYSPNKNITNIGGIDTPSPIVKKGWDYLDIFYSDSGQTITVEGVAIPLMRPLQATVHEIYLDGDFDLLLIGDGT